MKKVRITIDDLALMVKNGFDGVTKEFSSIRKEMARKADKTDLAKLVTKPYLDDKLADLKGDLIILSRKENQKVNTLVDTLHRKAVIDDVDTAIINSIQVFTRPPKVS